MFLLCVSQHAGKISTVCVGAAAGVRALNQKSHYRGIVAGLQSLAEGQGLPSSHVPQQAAAALRSALKEHAPMKLLQDRWATRRPSADLD